MRLTHIDRFDDATGEIAVGLRDMDKPFDDQTEDSRVVYLWWDVQPFTIEEMIEDLGTSKADQINRRPQTIHGFPTERVDIESPQNYAASASVFRCGDTNFALGTAIGFREKRDIFLHERIVETLSCSKNG